MAKWLEKLESAIGGGPSGPKRVRTLRILLILGLVGALFMLLNAYLPFKQVDTSIPESESEPEVAAWNHSPSPGSPFETIEKSLEARLKEILEKIVGVDSVSVLVTVDSTEEVVVERHRQESQSVTDETDKNGGTRHVTSVNEEGQVVLYEVSGDQKPIVTKTVNPKIRGILIVAKGAENATVRRLIVQAVERGINVAPNRISVVPSKQ
ncbi:stage III sporulation protein AG [Paenibacillus sp. J5C_2022]|uniref:stage III sporulation protein AG n=1 Tax=Paenibacillus sp. J5C2022 TaxID=2977129 RepID=UPI0021D0D84C|nr:stage III sporulation protein AG [Paenibacillus sp. J5C2022]MCU6710145.1 stage III sporulation protein AG [Paenibacillus sp. J5C2022]